MWQNLTRDVKKARKRITSSVNGLAPNIKNDFSILFINSVVLLLQALQCENCNVRLCKYCYNNEATTRPLNDVENQRLHNIVTFYLLKQTNYVASSKEETRGLPNESKITCWLQELKFNKCVIMFGNINWAERIIE